MNPNRTTFLVPPPTPPLSSISGYMCGEMGPDLLFIRASQSSNGYSLIVPLSRLILTLSYSPPHTHPLILTLSYSPSHTHPLILTLSYSPSHTHPLILALSYSPSHHPLILTLSWSSLCMYRWTSSTQLYIQTHTHTQILHTHIYTFRVHIRVEYPQK